MLFNYIFKVVVVGSRSIGKSSFVGSNNKYSHTDCMDPLGIHLQIVPQIYNNFRIQLQLWNIETSSKFIDLYHSYFQGARGYILCFDKSDRDSFKHLNSWIKIINIFGGNNIPIILVGTKSRLDNEVKENEIKTFIKNNKFISSYLSYNDKKIERDLIFKMLIKQILRRYLVQYERNHKSVCNPLEFQHLYEDLFQ